MLIHVHFLWNHVDILLAAVILVIIVKTIVVAIVVKGFGYNNKTSLLVRFSKAAIIRDLDHFIDRGTLGYVICVGWDVSGTNWGICFCSSEPRF